MYFHIYDPIIWFREERGVAGKQDGITSNIDFVYTTPRIYHWPAQSEITEDGWTEDSGIWMTSHPYSPPVVYHAHWIDWWGGHEAKLKALLRIPDPGVASLAANDTLEVELIVKRHANMDDYTDNIVASETFTFTYNSTLDEGMILIAGPMEIPSTVGADTLIPTQGTAPAELLGIECKLTLTADVSTGAVFINPIVVMLYPDNPQR